MLLEDVARLFGIEVDDNNTVELQMMDSRTERHMHLRTGTYMYI